MKRLSESLGINSRAVHAGTLHDNGIGGVNSPIFTSTALDFRNGDAVPYPRNFTVPNHDIVAKKIAALEFGESALVLSTGMSAIAVGILAAVKPGEHIVLQSQLYGGTTSLLEQELSRTGITWDIVDTFTTEGLLAALKPNTTLLYIETPSNPLLHITDISLAVSFAKEHSLLTMIDNTFASPVNQNPIVLGCDIVMHSATKYLGGHSDIMAGVLISTADFIQRCQRIASNFGTSLNAIDLSMLERSIKTMGLRVERQNFNAGRLASFLQQHRNVESVYYPGLSSHPGHHIAKQQMHGFGGMLSFTLKSQSMNAIDSFFSGLTLIQPATSLGGVESLITLPAMTSHKLIGQAGRAALGISEYLLRLSVGIEDIDDLIEELDKALA